LAHTLKGAARVVKQHEIAERAHAIEDVLALSREPGGSVARGQIDSILNILDEIGAYSQVLEPPIVAEAPAAPRPISEEVPRTVRADVLEIDAVLDGAEEAHARLSELRTAARTLDQARQMADSLEAQVAPQAGAGPIRLALLAAELKRQLGRLDRQFGSTTEQLDRELGQLRERAEQLRLVSTGTLFTALERTASDTAALLSKTVVFEGSGGEIRLDAHVLAVVQSALVQIVRNAVAHGIEPERERLRAGKPAAGRVAVATTRRGQRIVFECRDDGSGIDIDSVHRLALQRGMIPASTRPPSFEDLIDLLLRGGISTSESVTEAAGRGVGLDIVREALEQLHGEIKVRTRAGEGTVFEIIIPPTLAAMDVLVVEAAGMKAAVPLDAVRTSLRLATGAVSSTASGQSIIQGRETIPFLPLAASLGRRRPPSQGNPVVVVIGAAAGLAAVAVDRLIGTSRIVIRPLPSSIRAHAVVSSAWFDTEGNPQLLLDPDGLLSEARRQGPPADEAPSAGLPILVVDDSLTTRMLEQNILESAGYDVAIATSGEEALERARGTRYGLFLVDVEMPGIDGFTFIERVRSDPALHPIPAILVTSRASPEDRRRGREVGAQGYVIKSEFNQAEFLAMVAQLRV
jgi:two-component system chemotaxis sensor kinase CheA